MKTDRRARPVIHAYDDFRAYLRDTYDFLKQEKPQFSYRFFSRMAGYRSPNALKRVVDGERPLTNDGIARFSRALKLTSAEAQFFTNLVHFNQTQDPGTRVRIAREILKSTAYRKLHPLAEAQLAYFSNWYFVPIRELILSKRFREDPAWIAANLVPAITPQEAEAAIETLLRLGLVERDERGRLRHANVAAITTGDQVSSSFLIRYHQNMIRLGLDAIERFPRELRDISAVTFPLAAADLDSIKKRVQEFRKELLMLAREGEAAETVFQLNLQLFPLSAPVEVVKGGRGRR